MPVINGSFRTNPGSPQSLASALQPLENPNSSASWVLIEGVATGNIYVGGPGTSKPFNTNVMPHPVNTIVEFDPIPGIPYGYNLSQIFVDADGSGTVFFTAWTPG